MVDGPGMIVPETFPNRQTAAAYAVMLYGMLLKVSNTDVSELADFDLACYCPPDDPCHVDVLLELANPPATKPLLSHRKDCTQ